MSMLRLVSSFAFSFVTMGKSIHFIDIWIQRKVQVWFHREVFIEYFSFHNLTFNSVCLLK